MGRRRSPGLEWRTSSVVNARIRDSITGVLEKALADLKKSGGLHFDSAPEIRVEPTKDGKFGDVTTNIALILARQAGKPAPEVAKMIIQALFQKEIQEPAVFNSVQVGGPGFINFFLGREPLISILKDILNQDLLYGRSHFGKNKKVLIEFVSANPTGPLTLAHGRQAAVGDTLARIMERVGYQVSREYYLNDRGRQMRILGHSVFLRYQELLGKKIVPPPVVGPSDRSDLVGPASGGTAGGGIAFPEDFYQGDYIQDLAREVIQQHSDRFLKEKEEEAIAFFSKYAGDRIMANIQKDLNDFDVSFDRYFSEKEFVATGKVEACLARLKEKGYLYDKDGALWFRSTDFGDDKDRVLIKNTGEMTYISPDAAYHEDKLKRGFELLVDIWGPDHHGYIPRMKAALSALGYRPEQLNVIILQLATLYEGKNKLSMSTRRGEYVTLRQIIDEVGKDAGRYFFLMRRTDSHLDFDLELAKKQSPDNPVYYIQYAHARICSIFEKFWEEGGKLEKIDEKSLSLLEKLEPEEVELVKSLGLFQEVLEGCSDQLDPYGLTDYLLKTAQSFHHFYTQHRVVGEDLERSKGRLALVRAVQIVLRNGLELLGVSAPQAM